MYDHIHQSNSIKSLCSCLHTSFLCKLWQISMLHTSPHACLCRKVGRTPMTNGMSKDAKSMVCLYILPGGPCITCLAYVTPYIGVNWQVNVGKYAIDGVSASYIRPNMICHRWSTWSLHSTKHACAKIENNRPAGDTSFFRTPLRIISPRVSSFTPSFNDFSCWSQWEKQQYNNSLRKTFQHIIGVNIGVASTSQSGKQLVEQDKV